MGTAGLVGSTLTNVIKELQFAAAGAIDLQLARVNAERALERDPDTTDARLLLTQTSSAIEARVPVVATNRAKL